MRYPSPAFSIEALRKVIVGNRSTSRKSGLFRCASRCAWPVSTLEASMMATTDEFVRSSSSSSIVPVAPSK